MAANPKPDAWAELAAALARAAQEWRDNPDVVIRIPPQVSDAEVAELEREDQEEQARLDEMWAEMEREYAELKGLLLSDHVIGDRR